MLSACLRGRSALGGPGCWRRPADTTDQRRTLDITRSKFSIICVAPCGKQWLNNLFFFAKVTETRSLRKRRAHEIYQDNNTSLSTHTDAHKTQHWLLFVCRWPVSKTRTVATKGGGFFQKTATAVVVTMQRQNQLFRSVTQKNSRSLSVTLQLFSALINTLL